MCLAERSHYECLEAIHLLPPFFKPLFPASTVPPQQIPSAFSDSSLFSGWPCGFFLPLLPTSKLHLAAIARTHAHTCSKPFKQHSPFCTYIESSRKCSLTWSRGSSCLASGALPPPAPLLRKRAELLHPPILDEEQLLTSPVPPKIISYKQKRKKQEQKVQHFVMRFWVRGKKIFANTSLPSLSNLGKYQQDALDKVDFPCFCLELFAFSLWFWW